MPFPECLEVYTRDQYRPPELLPVQLLTHRTLRKRRVGADFASVFSPLGAGVTPAAHRAGDASSFLSRFPFPPPELFSLIGLTANVLLSSAMATTRHANVARSSGERLPGSALLRKTNFDGTKLPIVV